MKKYAILVGSEWNERPHKPSKYEVLEVGDENVTLSENYNKCGWTAHDITQGYERWGGVFFHLEGDEE